MKKKIIITLLAIVTAICYTLGFTACANDDNNGGGGEDYSGTYYLFEDEQYIEVEYYTLDGKNWSDAHNMGGTYEIKDGVISFYIDLFNQKTLWQQGTIGNGKLTIEGLSGKMVYYKKGMAHIHSFSGWKTLTDPDCTHSGEKMRACECGETERQSIPALGHDKTSDGIVYVPATCQNDGSISGTCDRCGQQFNEIIDKDPDAHYIEEDKDETTCSGCGLKLADSLSFYERGKEVAITNGDGVNVIIPAVYHGKPVTSTLNAFDNCKNLISIIIPDSVTSIGDYEFNGCTSLERITVDLDNEVYASQDGILYNKEKTSFLHVPHAIKGTITLPDSITSIGANVFENCTILENLYIPDSVTSIDKTAFTGCTQLIQMEGGVSYVDKWLIDCDTSVSTVNLRTDTIGFADYAFSGCTNLISISMPDDLLYIGKYAFSDCTGLKNINIPVGVSLINYNIFDNCISLESISVDQNNAKYSSQDGILYNKEKTKFVFVPKAIKTITIPESVSTIDSYAFKNCTSLTSINIPASVTSINSTAFNGCTSLESITVDENNDRYLSQDGVLYEYNASFTQNGIKHKYDLYIIRVPQTKTAVNIPDSTDGISDYAFSGCTRLTSVAIPDGLTSIANYAFKDCTSLKNINLDKISSVGADAFAGCTQLIQTEGGVSYVDKWVIGCDTSVSAVSLRTDTRGIASSAFKNCTSLTSITIPDSVTYIGNGAFEKCTSLENITVDPNNTRYLSQDGVLYRRLSVSGEIVSIVHVPMAIKGVVAILDGITDIYYEFNNRKNLEGVIIPDGVASIGEHAFEECTNLTSITIPDSVTSIGERAFEDCTSLESVKFGNNSKLETIDKWAFCDCTSLASITIPDGVTYIGYYAFYNCTSLKSVTFANKTGWKSNGDPINVDNAAQNAEYFTDTYVDYRWEREG